MSHQGSNIMMRNYLLLDTPTRFNNRARKVADRKAIAVHISTSNSW